MLNFPTLYAQSIIGTVVHEIELARFEKIREETKSTMLNPSLSRDEFAKLSPAEQQQFVLKMVSQKNIVRADPLIGEKGMLYRIGSFISFPILSVFTWGLIGFVAYVSTMVVRHRVNLLRYIRSL